VDDDAALVRLPDGTVLAATVDLFTPVVDDPYVYGRISAANSLSDIYAMGGTPRFALSVLGYPPKQFGPEMPARILQGAVDKAWEAGVVIAGGHSIKSPEVMFGLCVVGDFREGRVLEKGGAGSGDVVILTKPLGTGILTTAIKRGLLAEEKIARVADLMATLNDKASKVARECGATACTDVTGFGFLGHLLEMVTSSNLAVTVRSGAVPILEGARELAAAGVVPGGTLANLDFVSRATRFAPSVSPETRLLLADAQTSGGLLFAVPGGNVPAMEKLCAALGQPFAIVGAFHQGEPAVLVE
jgi:selenide,water dikinase